MLPALLTVGTTAGVVVGAETSRAAGVAQEEGSADRSGTVASDAGAPASQASPISKNAAIAAPVMYLFMPIVVRAVGSLLASYSHHFPKLVPGLR